MSSLSLLLAPDLKIYAYNELVDICERLVYVCFELLNMALQTGVCKQWIGLLEWITGLDYWTDL